jgi:hypothetical protein
MLRCRTDGPVLYRLAVVQFGAKPFDLVPGLK